MPRTFAHLESTLQTLVHILEEGREFAEADATNFLGMQSQFVVAAAAGGTRRLDGYRAGIDDLRTRLSSFLNAGGAAFTTWAQEFVEEVLGLPFESVQANWPDIYDYFMDNGERVKSRQITFDVPSANGSNVGNGGWVRLTKDARGLDLEHVSMEAKELVCSQDVFGGATRGAESFLFRGQAIARDALEQAGKSGIANRPIRCQLPRNDSRVLNASFDQISGEATAPTAITNWSSSVTVDGTSFSAPSSTNGASVFVPAPDDDAVLRPLFIKSSPVTLAQKFTVGKRGLDPNGAYLTELGYNASLGSASGTLTLILGALSNAATVTAGLSGWNRLNVLATQDSANAWYENFATEDLTLQVKWSGSGSIAIDDLWMVPYDFSLDGSGYVGRSGTDAFMARNPGVREGDKFNWSDGASEAVIQRHLARRGLYLPHSTSATVADP